VGWAKRQQHAALFGEFEHVVPGLGRVGEIVAMGLDLRCGINREGPLPALPVVAGEALADAGLCHRLELGLATVDVERLQASLLGDLADMRMIDDDKVIGTCQFLDREGFEILQRTIVPLDLDARLGLVQRGTGHHRVIAAGVAPGHAFQLGHSANSERIWALCSPTRGAARL